MFGYVFEPSMLTFDGSIFYILVHATLWFASVIIALVQTSDITSPGGVDWPDDAVQRTVYMYWLFTLLAPVLLVLYEVIAFFAKGYGMFRVPIHGFIFAFGILGLAFGTASVPYAVAADVIPVFTLGLFFAASGMGMFLTFYSEFRSSMPPAVKGGKDKVAPDASATTPLKEGP